MLPTAQYRAPDTDPTALPAPVSPSIRIVWSPCPGVSLRRERDVLVVAPPGRPPAYLPTDSEPLAEALVALGHGASDDDLLAALAGSQLNPERLFYCLGILRRTGLLVADIVSAEAGTLAQAIPYAREFDMPTPASTEREVQLSRFSLLRATPDGLLLENTEVPCALVVKHPVLAGWLHESANRPLRAGPGDACSETLDVLAQLGFLDEPRARRTAAYWSWEFHDRLFHRRTRRNDDFLPHGSTYRFRETFPPPPAVRPTYPGPRLALPTPAPRAGRGFNEVLDARRSGRTMSPQPVDLSAVGELLWRSARVIESVPSPDMELMRRPFPSGGAVHELELYLVAGRCAGLAPGFYHYMGAEHALVQLEDAAAPAARMLDFCAQACGQGDNPPHGMILVSVRLPRLAWKYESIAYKLALLDAGVVLQTLYLVATELGLAGTAAGSGDPRLFAEATGVPSWEETSLAEFGFGRPAT